MSLARLSIGLVLLAVLAGLAAHLPGKSGDTALVVHVGNNPADLRQFERWLGCPVQGVSIHTGQADWEDWSGSVGFQISRWRGVDRMFYWSVPLIPAGASLAEAAAGRYDERYAHAAQQIADSTSGDRRIAIRTGWEFNTDYMPWASHGKEKDFAGAYRRFVMAFRSVSPRFRFEWTPNIGGDDDPTLSYPGDAFVDVIGIDAYYNTKWNPTDARIAWMYNVDRRYGFRWLETFAADHSKPTAYAEWGVMSPSAAAYVEGAAAWFERRRPLYQSYWNTDSSFPGKLSSGAMPLVGAAFRSAFASCHDQSA